MATRRNFAGRQLRALRQRHDLRQADLAGQIGISVSYLSQIESDTRPLTDAIALRLARMFPIDWEDVAPADRGELAPALRAALAGEIADPALAGRQVERLVQQAPDLAEIMLRLIGERKQDQRRIAMLDDALGADVSSGGQLPWDEVRDWFHNQNNYVDRLDRCAEDLAGELVGDAPAWGIERLTGWLGQRGIGHVFRPAGALRRLVNGGTLLELDSSQPPETLRFQLAWQICSIAFADEIAEIVAGAPFRSDAARQLLSVGLGNYAAGALLMPYEAFRQAARDMRHDIDRLRAAFGTSFEQVCHRISTLQRPGARGVPAFFCRVDMAGNITKRHSATRLEFARYGGACPLWIVHEAVAVSDRILVQTSEMPDGTRYVSFAKGLVKPSASYRREPRRYAVALGCEMRHAEHFVYADGLDVSRDDAITPIGVSCRICPRDNCDQRAFPPSDRQITLDPVSRSVVPYSLVEEPRSPGARR